MVESSSGGESGDGQATLARRAWPAQRQWRLVAIAATLVVIAILGFWFVGRMVHRPNAEAAAPAPPPAGTFRPTPQQLKSFTVATVGRHAFVSEELTEGRIAVNADRTTPVYSPYSGRVVALRAGIGDSVRRGDALATIAAGEFAQAQSDLAAAVAQEKLARLNEQRRHALYEAQGASLQDWQQSQSDLAVATAALAAVRSRLRIFDQTPGEIAALERTPGNDPVVALNAPVSGVVIDRQLGPGQFLQAGGPGPVFTIADTSTVWLIANVRETDAGIVKVGQPVEVQVLAWPKRIFRARLSKVSAVVDPAIHRIAVRADIDNRDGALKPDMAAYFRILTSEASDAVAVPEGAIVYEGDEAHVWVLAPGGVVAYRAITAGRRDGELVEVVDGLKSGEQIITRGALFIDQAAPRASP